MNRELPVVRKAVSVATLELPPKPEDGSFSEEEIVRAASSLCMQSEGHIVLIGGQTSLPSISGAKKYRKRSAEIDLVADDTGMYSFLVEDVLYYVTDGDYLLFSRGGMPCSVFSGDVRGFPVPFIMDDTETTDTEYGRVVHASPEMTAAMKIRRGAMKGHQYAKDALDIFSLAMSRIKAGEELDTEIIADCVSFYACDKCTTGSYMGCVSENRRMLQHVPAADREYLTLVSLELENSLRCRYHE